jgi:hypothetical protein
MLLSVGLAGATLSFLITLLLPQEWESQPLRLRLLLLLAAFLLSGYPFAFFLREIRLAMGGEASRIRSRRWFSPRQILWSASASWGCFLAGPIVPAGVAVWFFLNSGDLEWVDRLILVELSVVTMGLWVLALVAVAENSRLRDANPAAVARLAGRLDWRGWLAVLLAAVGMIAFVSITLAVLTREDRGAIALLVPVSLGAVSPFGVALLLRSLGLGRVGKAPAVAHLSLSVRTG